MKKLTTASVVLGVALGVAAAQQSEPYPGQREHQKPPDGWFCNHFGEAEDAAHTCWCAGMSHDPLCKSTPKAEDDPNTDEDESQQPAIPSEDPKCTVYCHRDACKCKVLCKDS